MKRRSKRFGGVPEFTYIAEIFISNSGGITTICGNRISNEEVCIKVCYMKTKGSPGEISDPLSLKRSLLTANRNALLAGPVYSGLEIR